mgnify:CR=1 FL=1
MKRTPATILTLLIAVSLLAVPALADGGVPSTVPHTFYGQVYDIDGSKAPAGSIVVAAVAGAPAGTITVAPAGQYGKDYTDGDADKLGVWHSAIQPGDTIAFYIDGVRAAETAVYESGGLTNLTLTASAALPKKQPGESTTRPVNTTAGQPVTVNAGNASVDLTATGNFQGETLVFTLFTVPPDDQAIPPGNDEIGRFAEITSTITNDNLERVRVTLHYTDADVAGIDESSIRVYWWSTENSTWVQLEGGVDTAANFAWGETNHFSTFALLGVTPPKPSPTGGGPGGGVFVVPTSSVTPTTTGEGIPAPADTTGTPAVTPTMTGASGAPTGAGATQSEAEAGTTGDLPVVAVAMILGTVAVIAAGFLLLRRR